MHELYRFAGLFSIAPAKIHTFSTSRNKITKKARRCHMYELCRFAGLQVCFLSLRPKIRDFSTEWNKIEREVTHE